MQNLQTLPNSNSRRLHRCRKPGNTRFWLHGLVGLAIVLLVSPSMALAQSDSLIAVHRAQFENPANSDSVRTSALYTMCLLQLYRSPTAGDTLVPKYKAWAEAHGTPEQKMRAYVVMAEHHIVSSNPQAALEVAQEGLKQCVDNNCPVTEVMLHQRAAATYNSGGDYAQAMQHMIEAAKGARKTGAPSSAIGEIFVQCATLLFNAGDLEGATAMCDSAMALVSMEQAPLPYLIQMAILHTSDQLPEASELLNRLAQLNWEEQPIRLYNSFLGSAPDLYAATGRHSEAIALVRKGIALAHTLNFEEQLFNDYLQLAHLLIQTQGDALSAMDSATAYASDSWTARVQLAEGYYMAHKRLGHTAQSLEWLEQLNSAKDSMHAEVNAAEMASLRTQFDYEQRMLTDSLKQHQAHTLAKLEQTRIQNRNTAVGIGLLLALLIAIGFVAFAVQRARTIQAQNVIIEQQRDQIQRDFLHLKDFTENAAHEMQTPMAVIRSKLEALLQSPDFSEEQVHNIMAVYGASGRLTHLNKSLPLLARIENKQYQVSETINYSKVVNQYLDWFHELMEHHELHVTANVAASLELQSNQVLADTLVSNLLKNAIRHNVDGGRIDVELNRDHLRISNTGQHITRDPSTLFERFQKADATREGTGLGLAIVKEAVEAHGWQVTYCHDNGTHTLEIGFTSTAA